METEKELKRTADYEQKVKDAFSKSKCFCDDRLLHNKLSDKLNDRYYGNFLLIGEDTAAINELVLRYLKEKNVNIVTVTSNGYEIQKKRMQIDIAPGSCDVIFPGEEMTDKLKKENTVLFLPNLDGMNDLIYRRFLLDMIRTHIVADSRNGKHGYTKLHYSFFAIATVGKMDGRDFYELINNDAKNCFMIYNLDEE